MDGSALALSSPDTLSLSLSEMEGAPCQVTTYSEYDNVTSDDNTGEPWPPGQQEGGAGEDTGPGAGTQVTGQLQVRIENIIRYNVKDWHQVISTYFQSQWMKLSWNLPIWELMESIKLLFHAYYDAIKADIMSRISKIISFLIRAASYVLYHVRFNEELCLKTKLILCLSRSIMRLSKK